MASQMDALNDPPAGGDGADRIDEHLRSALESTDDDRARYHLREALQLQIAEMS